MHPPETAALPAAPETKMEDLEQLAELRKPQIGDSIKVGPWRYRVRKRTHGGDLVLREIR